MSLYSEGVYSAGVWEVGVTGSMFFDPPDNRARIPAGVPAAAFGLGTFAATVYTGSLAAAMFDPGSPVKA